MARRSCWTVNLPTCTYVTCTYTCVNTGGVRDPTSIARIRDYHYLPTYLPIQEIIFPSKSRVLNERGHRQHHALGEYETIHSLISFPA